MSCYLSRRKSCVTFFTAREPKLRETKIYMLRTNDAMNRKRLKKELNLDTSFDDS